MIKRRSPSQFLAHVAVSIRINDFQLKNNILLSCCLLRGSTAASRRDKSWGDRTWDDIKALHCRGNMELGDRSTV